MTAAGGRLRADIALLLAAQRALAQAYVPPAGLPSIDDALESALGSLVVADDGLRAPQAVADQGERVERLYLALIIAVERWVALAGHAEHEAAPALAATVKAYAEAIARQRAAPPAGHKQPRHDIRPPGRGPSPSFAALSDPERVVDPQEEAHG